MFSRDNFDFINVEKLIEKSTKIFTQLVLMLLIWSLLWAFIGEPAMPPKGFVFNALVLFILSHICGKIADVFKCPPILGSLIIGFIYSNVFKMELNTQLSAALRSMALVVILLRAGFELDPIVVRKMSLVCLRMAFIPCIVEVLSITFATYLLLDFPIKWGFLLGFILSAASPAIVVPGMLKLQEKKLGTDKGIPTIVIAAASLDDILAITGFGVCLGLVFNSNTSLVWSILKGPVEAIVGVVVATLIGMGLWYIPNSKDSKLERILLLICFGLVAMFVSQALQFESFGTLACIVLSFVVALKWRTNGWDEPIQVTLKTLWHITDPLLFALIGFEVSLSDLKSSAIGFAILALIIGLILRTIASMIVIIGANLNLKEKIYVSLAWAPKATVQAAIGSIALDLANQRDDKTAIELATFVMTISVLSIVITAPLGAIWIAAMGSICLKKSVPIEEISIDSQESNGSIELNNELKIN